MIQAADLVAGQWLIRTSGVYRVDSVAVSQGLAYVGTNRGVCVLPADTPVMIGDSQ